MRRFRTLIAVLGLFIFLAPAGETFAQNWYRGNIHMHTFWSDGNAFPETAAAWYRDHGYHFIVLSDHNLLQLDDDTWREVGKGKLTRDIFDEYVQRFGPDSIETRKKDDRLFVRLKTIGELKKQFDRPGEYLLVPGQETNRVVHDRQVHMNLMNTSAVVPYQVGTSVADTLRRNLLATRANGDENSHPVLFVQNHHSWPYFDAYPEDLIQVPEIRFFELCNTAGGTSYRPHPDFWSIETFWDIVNAHRIEDGYPAIYGLATDDTHEYHRFADGLSNPGHGWIVVRAESLTAEDLLAAMYRGDFYSSTGVELDDIQYMPENRRLNVKVAPRDDTRYTIRFVGTKKGFDRSTTITDDPAEGKKPARKIPVYSDQIGQTLKEVSGTEASYTLKEDDLYVRAIITSDRRPEHNAGNEPEFTTAWTQPYGCE
jgi:hypothetical protein